MVIYHRTKCPRGLGEGVSMLTDNFVYLFLAGLCAKGYVDCSSFYPALPFSKVFLLYLTLFPKLHFSRIGSHDFLTSNTF